MRYHIRRCFSKAIVLSPLNTFYNNNITTIDHGIYYSSKGASKSHPVTIPVIIPLQDIALFEISKAISLLFPRLSLSYTAIRLRIIIESQFNTRMTSFFHARNLIASTVNIFK